MRMYFYEFGHDNKSNTIMFDKSRISVNLSFIPIGGFGEEDANPDFKSRSPFFRKTFSVGEFKNFKIPNANILRGNDKTFANIHHNLEAIKAFAIKHIEMIDRAKVLSRNHMTKIELAKNV